MGDNSMRYALALVATVSMAIIWGITVAQFINAHWPHNTLIGLLGIPVAFGGGWILSKFMSWYVK